MAKKRRSKGTREVEQKVGEETPAEESAEQPAARTATQDGSNGVDKSRSYEEVRPKG